MNITEINKSIPAHWPKLIEAGHIACAYEIRVSHAPANVRDQFRAVFIQCRAGFTDRYLDYAEEVYGAGTVDSGCTALFTVACVRERDWQRLYEVLTSTKPSWQITLRKI